MLPVDLKYCIDAQLRKSTIELGFIPDVSYYDDVTDEQLRTYLDQESVDSKAALTMTSLDEIVARELRMNMDNRNARSRMQQLFVQYHALLTTHGLTWIVTENQKLAVSHVLSAIKPVSLKERLEADLSFSHHDLKNDFKSFLSHAVKLSEPFQLVDAGRRPRRTEPRHGEQRESFRKPQFI